MMIANKGRRELFSSLSSSLKNIVNESKTEKKEAVVRPPYFGDKNAFDIECQNCEGLCATSCQEQIIIIGEDKTPHLDFSKSGCTYCDECAIACEPNVLALENKKEIDVDIIISQKSCMSWNGVMCFSCKDPCLEDAIDFQGIFKPVINAERCTACGFCISRCPSFAIEIKDSL